MSAGKDGLIERYWAFANSGIRCVGIGSTITEARNNVIFSTIEDNDDAIVDDYAARLNAQAAQILALEADKAALVEALEFYSAGIGYTEIEDGGEIARATLAKHGGK